MGQNEMMAKAGLRLFITADSPGSRAARKNLEAALGTLGIDMAQVAVVDVLEDPGTALDAGVIVTPTLEIVGDLSRALIAGRLADIDGISARIDSIRARAQASKRAPAERLRQLPRSPDSPGTIRTP